MPKGISLPFISFVRRLITTTSMAPKKTQVVHVNKGNDKIRIDNLRMSVDYQPPKFQSFDGKGNPKRHIAHFVETCNNTGTEGDLLVKQFIHSL
ncbi:hypothetical protein PVL29_003798 [Vitis rotundifolia]|uniref:Ty3-gypsy retrotransposon protein n=1 Tax=Vitis rotundifolia TaxID=103349 RepID=A0AA39AF17_VITRO|nr:hypothetical protein PVL29_003798 [Vitis rotundifolia]